MKPVLVFCYANSADKLHLDLLKEESESELLRFIYDFNEVVFQSCSTYKPSVLCHYLFYMCKAFNRFYAEHSVLKAEGEKLQRARLALVSALSQTLKQGLFLLGITPPDRM